MGNSNIGHSIRWGRRGGNEKDVFYTPPALAKLCIEKVPLNEGDVVLDPCSGNGAFYDQFPSILVHKRQCEIEHGTNFYDFTSKVDWCISNPPYSHLDTWLKHSCSVSQKGFAYLLGWNNLTAKRMESCEHEGFGITSITMFKVFQWYGMSAFVVWEKNKRNILEYDRTVWK